MIFDFHSNIAKQCFKLINIGNMSILHKKQERMFQRYDIQHHANLSKSL